MDLTKLDIENVLLPLKKDELRKLSRKDLESLFLGEQELRLKAFETLEEKYCVEGYYLRLKRRFYMPSTEKSPSKKKAKKKNTKKKKPSSKKILLPSERYPNAEIIDKDVILDSPPECDGCGSQMINTGLNDISEMLTVIPKKYIIERHFHPKFKCSCCQTMITTPRVPRIKPGSSYSDAMIIDVAMSKYCDLIPLERYATMAKREGFEGLPPNSLIELTHYLAHFASPLVDKIKQELLQEIILHADETTHRMMEQKDRKQWYLWGFSTIKGAYFECHPSRSGDIAVEILKESKCLFLLTDVYAGYGKAIRLANELREEGDKITEAFCNAHARRKFKENCDDKLSVFFIWCYKRVYFLEKTSQNRVWQDRYFRAMKRMAEKIKIQYSTKSGLYGAASYFSSNYTGLTKFLKVDGLSIDNNSQERLIRSPVIGRKTWHGTHSILGGQTSAKLFTIVESCKLNRINPRLYLREMVKRSHQKKKLLTPFEAKKDFPQIFSPN